MLNWIPLSAWPVNFKYAIATFEPAIRGHRKLIDLALASHFVVPPKFLFISSISVARRTFYPVAPNLCPRLHAFISRQPRRAYS